MLFTLIAEVEHELAPIIAPPLVLAGIAAAFFLLVGLVTYSYRDVANRHSDKVGDAPADAGHH